ncbi:MAG: transposase [Planctomycetales bacterium]|nr:transposase [Planctomycetales bacterium]
MNDEQGRRWPFHWQDGYGAFTVSRSKVDAVIDYIEKQMEHHNKQSFQDEYLKMLTDHDIEYDRKYLWE